MIVLLSLSACGTPQAGSNSPAEREELMDLADTPMDPEEKYFAVAEKFHGLMVEANQKVDDAGAAAHIEEFLADNETAFRLLTIQLDNWQKGLTEEERLFFISELNARPISRQLRNAYASLRTRFSDNPAQTQIFDRLLQPLRFYR